MPYALLTLLYLVFLPRAAFAGANAENCPSDYANLATQGAATEARLATNDFVIRRGLLEYQDFLDVFPRDNFSSRMRNLRPDQHWIDMGAGIAAPMLERLGAQYDPIDEALRIPAAWPDARARLPRMTGVVLSDNFKDSNVPRASLRTLDNARQHFPSNQFSYRSGRRIEDYQNPVSELGRAQLITDVFGPAAYTRDLSRVLEQYTTLLEEGGAAYIYGLFKKTTILDACGRSLSPTEFLSRIPGIDYRIGRSGAIRMNRQSGPIRIPRLELRSYDSGTHATPTRVFQIVD